MELREYGLALWSLTSLRSVDPGFGTAYIGMEYIPGRSEAPRDEEKRPCSVRVVAGPRKRTSVLSVQYGFPGVSLGSGVG